MRAPRWYVDADTIGVGHVLARARVPVTWPGDDGVRDNERRKQAPSPIQRTDVPDDDWIPRVTAAGMAIITRDRRILSRLDELAAVKRSGAVVFAITSDENLDLWGLVQVVGTRWRDIERLSADPGPAIYSVTRTAVSRLPLPP